MTDQDRGPWVLLREQYERGALRRAALIAALRSKYPIPDFAKKMIADVIEGSGKALKEGRPAAPAYRQAAAVTQYQWLVRWIEDPDSYCDWVPEPSDADMRFLRNAQADTKLKNRQRVSAKARAKAFIVKRYDIDQRTLDNWIRKRQSQDEKTT